MVALKHITGALGLGLFACMGVAQADGNGLTYLDESDPYYVSQSFPKLVTPQWLGEADVDAVIILSIDDMRDPEKYEAYLRPILDRLKEVTQEDAPVSIMCNTLDTQDPRLQSFLEEGLSLDVHTMKHPCPLLAKNDFVAAEVNVHDCVDLMKDIPGNTPVAFRMPCCDSQNTPSPRFYAEIFNQTSISGNFLQLDSSVFCVLTPNDPEVPKSLSLDADGQPRFRKYLPFPSFVNTIEDYPYPYVIGQRCWEIPCTVPSDWEAQHINGKNNPRSVADMKAALDAVVAKQGVYTLVFHPHGWIENTQVVELIDHAVATYGTRIKFMTFREVADRLQAHLLKGEGLRNAEGDENGVRLMDLNRDGYLDVVIGNDRVQVTRIWDTETRAWRDKKLPFKLVSQGEDTGFRFGDNVDGSGNILAFQSTEVAQSAYTFKGLRWKKARSVTESLKDHSSLIFTRLAGMDYGLRFRDLDHDGRCEMLIANAEQRSVFSWDEGWREWSGTFPPHAQFVDAQGRDQGLRLLDLDGDGDEDMVFSNEAHFGVYLFSALKTGWAQCVTQGARTTDNTLTALPMITRNGTSNGAWFHSEHLWVQNEDTASLPDLVERRSFTELLAPQK